MRIMRFALALGLVLLLIAPCVADMNADMDQSQMNQQAMNATVKAGPRLKAGLPLSADVFVNGYFAMRIPASAGGLDPMQRANVIADRLNDAFAKGMSWQDTQVLARDGLWTVNIGDNLIATADVNSARAFDFQTGRLAGRWARQSVIAMGGQPQMIAQQLMPITSAVAGSIQELGANWMIAPIKSVSVINIASRESMGNVTVAGAQTNLNKVAAVALYAYAADSANIYLFVPTSSSTITGANVPRVMGVGLLRLPTGVVPMTNVLMGDQALNAINEMTPDQWNEAINGRLAAWRIQLQATTKVVPLYSLSMKSVAGAAQVVGDANAVAQTNAVVVSDLNNNLSFGATSTAPSDISGQPATMNNVVVSALIVFPTGTDAMPAMMETP